MQASRKDTCTCLPGHEDDGAVQLGSLAGVAADHLHPDVSDHLDPYTHVTLRQRAAVQQPLAHLPHPTDLHHGNHLFLVSS